MYFLSWTWSGLGSSPLLSGHSVQLEVGLLCFQLGGLQIEEQNLGCNFDCVVSGVWVMFLKSTGYISESASWTWLFKSSHY